MTAKHRLNWDLGGLVETGVRTLVGGCGLLVSVWVRLLRRLVLIIVSMCVGCEPDVLLCSWVVTQWLCLVTRVLNSGGEDPVNLAKVSLRTLFRPKCLILVLLTLVLLSRSVMSLLATPVCL